MPVRWGLSSPGRSFCSGEPGIFALARAGRLPSVGTAFFAKESGGKENLEGGYHPSGLPQGASRLMFYCGGISYSGGTKTKPGAYEQPVVLPANPGGRRPPTWRGVERETRSSPLRRSFPGFFSRKEIGRCPRRTPARRGQPLRVPRKDGKAPEPSFRGFCLF